MEFSILFDLDLLTTLRKVRNFKKLSIIQAQITFREVDTNSESS